MKELLNNKKLIGVYLLWFTSHFIILILSINENSSKRWQQEFWPFTEGEILKTYNITEFIIYLIIPLALIISINLIFPPKK